MYFYSHFRKRENQNNKTKENIDFIDFKSTRHEMTSKSLLSNLGYSEVDFIDILNCYVSGAQQLLEGLGYGKIQIAKA